MRKIFAKTITEIIDNDKTVHVVSLDFTGLGIFDRLIGDYPNHYLNLGVTEQASIGVAAGMALEGLKPYVYGITPFILERPFEQIKLDIVEQKADVKLIGFWAYPNDGPTHITKNPKDICKILNIPFYEPKNIEETKQMILETYQIKGPAFFNLIGEDLAKEKYYSKK